LPSAWSLLPPAVAIGLALATRRVPLSLTAGILTGAVVLAGGNPLLGAVGTVRATLDVVAAPSNARLLLFALLIGPLVATMQASRGIDGLVGRLETRGLVRGPRGARLLAWLIGIVIFVETNITLLITGAVARPLFDRYREPRERLAYIADCTSAPVCILIPFNAWGALILGLLAAQQTPDPLRTFAGAIPLNLYALASVLLAGWTAWSGWNLGPMRRAALAAQAEESPEDPSPAAPEQPRLGDGSFPARARNMLVPLLVMMAALPVALLVTGGGNLTRGSGSISALAAVLAGNAAAWLLVLGGRLGSVADLTRIGLRGARSLAGLVLILALAMVLGEVCNRLDTGPYVAGLLSGLAHPALLLPATFLVGAIISFATGTSWGTFAITIPVAVPAAEAMGLPLSPFLAACLSGGIFGDHASPISDTTIVASMASGTSVIDHVRTQLPYALLAGAAATVGFAVMGGVL
jgi:tetracycline resistance efflux pump